MKSLFKLFGLWVIAGVLFSGCGYTSKMVLPHNIQSIHVDTVKNKINIHEMYAHEGGLEMDITNAVVERFLVDGNLKVASRETADSILELELVKYEQEGLRFDSLESVREYRLFLVVDAKLVHRDTGEIIWHEPYFSGDSEYFVGTIPNASRRSATLDAASDLARRIVDRVVEDW